jgi:Sulfatase
MRLSPWVFPVSAWSSFTRLWHGDRARRLHGLLGFLLAVFCTHAALRVFLLFRHDAYGQPLVGKADWYIFHAFSFDYLWIFGYSLPLVLIGAWFGKAFKVMAVFLALAHAVLLLFTVLDHETLRFLGMHLDPSLLSTYGNAASIREVFKFVADDRSVRYLPYALFFGSVPVAALLTWVLRRQAGWVTSPRLSGRAILSLTVAGLVTWAYVHVLWTGGFRRLKLRPFIETAYLGLMHAQSTSLADAEWQALSRDYQAWWQMRQGDSSWVFPDSLHPYVREPRQTCQPTGEDLPGDGIDQDCNGVDARPVNIVLLIFESHRAVNCGHLMPYGATASATPRLDALAAQGRFFTRFSVGGLPTINALMATHLGIAQHPTRYMASDFTTMANLGFPSVLGQQGYATHFFSAADPAWDNQTPWLRQWYQGLHYDRSREADAPMLRHMARYMLDSLAPDQPFFVTAMTKTNHYPFNGAPGVEGPPAGASLQDKMLATMRYADAAMGDFIDSLRQAPWFGHTIFLIMGDHGFPLGEHGSSTIGYGLYTESTWIPLVVYGEHPRLPLAGPSGMVASQVDLGPTLLDLAGITQRNHFTGHSLLRPATDRGETWVLRGEQSLLENLAYRVHGPWGESPREQGLEIFDGLGDRSEKRNLLKSEDPLARAAAEAALAPALARMRDMAKLHIAVIEGQRLWAE